MIKFAGWLMVLYGAAHTIGALTIEGAGVHAGAWFSGQLWNEDFSNMSAANSALWFSLASFGPTLALLGLTILWLNRRGILPPEFIAWTLGALTLIDGVILLFTPWPILLGATILLLVGIRRSDERLNPPPHAS